MIAGPPVHTTILFDIRSPEGGRPATELIQAAVEHAAYADHHGFTSISITEHHATDDGYMPSPVVFGAAVAAVTEKVLIRLGAVILPLHNPLRLAEDLAMLDLVSGGRLRLIVGIGYREREYLQLGVDKKRRVAILEEGVETLKQAWTGEPFDYQGRTVRVLPRPAQQPRPAIIMGGGAPETARRAARIADGFQPVVPEIYDQYLQELTALGKALPGPNSADVGKATIRTVRVRVRRSRRGLGESRALRALRRQRVRQMDRGRRGTNRVNGAGCRRPSGARTVPSSHPRRVH